MQGVVDREMEIDPRLFKEGLRDKSVGLRAKDYTKQVREKGESGPGVTLNRSICPKGLP